MAAESIDRSDPLQILRLSIEKGSLPIPTSSKDATINTDAVTLEYATHLQFNLIQDAVDGPQHISFEASFQTLFQSQAANAVVDLLSIYFCWLNKDSAATEYIAAAHALNEARAKNGLSSVLNLVFAEKLDLVTWLSGDARESDYIKQSASARAEVHNQARDAADVASGQTGDVGPAASYGQSDQDRVKEITSAERSMGDHDTVLQGTKYTDFSHVRKIAEAFLRRTAVRANGSTTVPANISRSGRPQGGRRVEPIILLSPSASSLLRLSNIQSFLTEGVYVPPASASSGTNMLFITRVLPTIDPTRAMRFILVESPENFKPDYWNRVVAVVTTGQAWQFKGYKWQNPAELFSHALGLYLGWRGESVPETIKSWGRGVLSVAVDPVRDGQTTAQARWRDREVVEEVWSGIEASMRTKGWRKDGI